METLAEDLLLIALDDDDGTVSWQRSPSLPFGLGGALLMDLALLERIKSVEHTIILADPSPTGDEVLDAALEMIRTAGKPHDGTHWVKTFGRRPGLQEELARRLVARGILREQQHSFLRVFHASRFPTSDPRPESALRDQIRDAVLGRTEPETRTLLLMSLITACHLTDTVLGGDERKEAQQRIKDLVEGEQFGKAVGTAIAELVAATAATAAAAFTVSVAPGAHP